MLTRLIHDNPDVYLLKVPFTNISTNATNVYIVTSNNESLIIDVGAPTDEGTQIVQAALEELDINPAHTKFFLTHFHLDHAGLVDLVIPASSPLYVSETEYGRTRPGGKTSYSDEVHGQVVSLGASDEEASTVRQMKLNDGCFVGENHDFVFVKEGDVIEVGDFSFEVIDTSGHTPGHISLLEPQEGLFFGGDHMLFVISPSIDYFSTELDGLEIYRANLKKLMSLPIRSIFPAHGDARDDFQERIDWLLVHQESRLEELLALIEDRPGSKGIDLIKALRWNVPTDCWEEIPLIQRSIIIVQGFVLLEHLEKTGQIEKNKNMVSELRYQKR